MDNSSLKKEEILSSNTSKPEFINLNVHKAGLDGLDQEKINKIIQEASKGSNFYSFQQKRQERIVKQIDQLKSKLEQISEHERQLARTKADILMMELEQHRILNRIIVHFDMDMFFAAVEIKKNPSLADKPMAVGSLAMISTSNYIARKFGVRSAMAGFIAKKLCPQLILIKPNFHHYSQESEVVMKIISEYDPNLRTCSLDEVYIDLTDYVFSRYSHENDISIEQLQSMDKLDEEIWQFAFNIVNDIRKRVFEETKLSVSAGISCNTLLAKVCTDINKPNGQFMIIGNKDKIMDFVAKTEIRKFTGIGPVRGQILAAFNVKKASDIYAERSLLLSLFSELNVRFYFRVYLGIGSSNLNSDDETVQKSHSRERTVGELSDFNAICLLLKEISSRLSKDLKNESQSCKTITLKLKKTTFEVFIRSRTIDKFTQDENVIYKVAKELLSQELTKSPSNKYRLIGLRASNLLNNQDESNDQLTLSQFLSKSNQKPNKLNEESFNLMDDYECILCDQTFDNFSDYEMHKHYCEGDFILLADNNNTNNDHLNDEKILNDEEENFLEKQKNNKNISQTENSNRIEMNVSTNDKDKSLKEEEEIGKFQYLKCPICQSSTLFSSNADLNRHIDICLNREVCIELTTFKNRESDLNDSILGQSSIARQQQQTKIINQVSTNKNKRESPSSSSSSSSANTSKKSNKKRCNTVVANQPRIDHYFH